MDLSAVFKDKGVEAEEEAEKRARTMQEGYPFVAIRDNAVCKVKYYVPDSYEIHPKEPYTVNIQADMNRDIKVMAKDRKDAEKIAGDLLNSGKVAMNMSYDLKARKCTDNAGNAAEDMQPEVHKPADKKPQREAVMEINGLKIVPYADGLYYILSPNGKCVKSGLPLAKAEDICNKTVAALARFGLADDDMAITLYMSVFAEGE